MNLEQFKKRLNEVAPLWHEVGNNVSSKLDDGIYGKTIDKLFSKGAINKKGADLEAGELKSFKFDDTKKDIQIGSVSKAKCRLKSDVKPVISLDKIRVLITFEFITEERKVESYTCPATEEVFEYLDAEHLRFKRVIRYSDIIEDKFYENHFVRSKNSTTWETYLRNYKECYKTVEVLYERD
jgi:hypothetical protein